MDDTEDDNMESGLMERAESVARTIYIAILAVFLILITFIAWVIIEFIKSL